VNPGTGSVSIQMGYLGLTVASFSLVFLSVLDTFQAESAFGYPADVLSLTKSVGLPGKHHYCNGTAPGVHWSPVDNELISYAVWGYPNPYLRCENFFLTIKRTFDIEKSAIFINIMLWYVASNMVIAFFDVFTRTDGSFRKAFPHLQNVCISTQRMEVQK
jgi:hypothetical protein